MALSDQTRVGTLECAARRRAVLSLRTNTIRGVVMTVTNLEDLSDAATNAVAALTTRRTFEEARAALGEAGMQRARNRLGEALNRIEDAQAELRAVQVAANAFREGYDAAVFAVEWGLDAKFVTEGAKTFLVDGDEKRPMTADQRREWKQRAAGNDTAVIAAAHDLSLAEQTVAAKKDAVVLADKAFSAARIDLDAAIATVGLFAAAIQTSKESNQ